MPNNFSYSCTSSFVLPKGKRCYLLISDEAALAGLCHQRELGEERDRLGLVAQVMVG